MASKSITLTAQDMEQRIATVCRSLSRKKFTLKQLKQFIVNGQVPNETKRSNSGYQLFLDDFRKDLTKEERAQVGQVAKDGAAAWKVLDEDEKQPYLYKANELKEVAIKANSKTNKTPKSKKDKMTDDEDEDDEIEDKPKSKKDKAKVKMDDEDEVDKLKKKTLKSKKDKVKTDHEN